MNAEKLYVVLKTVLNDINSTKIQKHLQGIITTMGSLNTSPNPSLQQNLATSLTSFLDGVGKSTYDDLPPSFRQIINDVSPKMLLGEKLGNTVKGIVERNQITYQVAINELTPYFDSINVFLQNANAYVASCDSLEIRIEDLDPGECEIGFLIPKEEIKKDFHIYQEELHDFELLILAKHRARDIIQS